VIAQPDIRHIGLAALDPYRPLFVDLYREVYAEPPYLEGDEHVADYVERFADESSRPGFALVVAEIGTELVGYAYGHSFGPDEWWPDADHEPVETKGLTKFGICELAVRKPHRGKGIGTMLMKSLLDGRPEELATLCSNPATSARQIYQRWGWQQAARAYPATIPPMDILIIPLARPLS